MEKVFYLIVILMYLMGLRTGELKVLWSWCVESFMLLNQL